MVDGYLERKIHNIGFGGFCTECVGTRKTEAFTVVYDCGSMNGALLEKKVSRFFNSFPRPMGPKPRIDFLFLSHFDNDHISGVKLLEKYMDKNSKVFIPFFEEAVYIPLSYIDISDNPYKNYKGFINDTHNYNIIRVNHFNSEEDIRREPLNLENLVNRSRISSGSILCNDSDYLWEYIPFNLQEISPDDLKKKFVDKKFITDAEFEKLKNHDVNAELIKRVTERYKKDKTFLRNPSKGTLSNANSMLLVSQKAPKTLIRESTLHIGNSICKGCKMCCEESCSRIILDDGSCLYTGDAALGDSVFYKRFVDKIKDSFLTNGVSLLQLPHHGTEAYRNVNLVRDLLPDFCFANNDNGSRWPVSDYYKVDCEKNGIQLQVVSEKEDSKISQLVEFWG